MVELKYVKHRKQKRIAAIVSACASVLIIFLIILSFMGETLGTCTVSLRTSRVKVALTEEYNSTDYTTYIRASNLAPFSLCTNGFIKDEFVDDDQFSYDEIPDATIKDEQGNIQSVVYFKQTFYVVNLSNVPVKLHMKVNIVENNRPNNVSYGFDDLLRVRVYKNLGNSIGDGKDYETYAKRAQMQHVDKDGFYTYQEPISGSPMDSDFPGFAEMFKDSQTVLETDGTYLAQNQSIRYSFVFWLEGSDPQCRGDAPIGGSIKLGIDIDAYE